MTGSAFPQGGGRLRTPILAALLAVTALVPAADAQSPSPSFNSMKLPDNDNGSTGNISGMSVKPTGAAGPITLNALLAKVPVVSGNVVSLLNGPALGVIGPNTFTMAPTGLSLTAPPSQQVPWAGANPFVAQNVDLTAQSDVQQEAGAIIKMSSGKGAKSGTGALSAFKIPLGTELTMLPGSGNGYAFNAVVHAKPGVGYQQVSGIEVNVDIENRAYPPTPGQPFATSLILQGINKYPQTAMMFVNNAGFGLGQTPAGKYQSYEGIWFYGPWTVKDHTFRDDTNSAVSYSSTGDHSGSTFSDSGTSPVSLNLSGNYPLAAIFTGNATTTNALIAAPGQKVCFNGDKNGSCMYYSASAKKLYFTNAAGANIMSVDGGGVVRATAFVPGPP